MMFGEGMGGFMILAWLMPILGFTVLITVLVLLIRRPDAHQILDERYARGEINENEYKKRRSGLMG